MIYEAEVLHSLVSLLARADASHGIALESNPGVSVKNPDSSFDQEATQEVD